MNTEESFTVFAGCERIDQGPLVQVAKIVKSLMEAGQQRSVLVFADGTGTQVDIDLRGSSAEVLARYSALAPKPAPEPEPAPRRPGRPKLGVVGREVTLLPRHWEWLSVQPGGPSVVLRKLVEQARLGSRQTDLIRLSREATYRFVSAIAGNEPGFEEACRALFAGDLKMFHEQIEAWPTDVRHYARSLAAGAQGAVE